MFLLNISLSFYLVFFTSVIRLSWTISLHIDEKSKMIIDYNNQKYSRKIMSSINVTGSRIIGGFNASIGGYPFFAMALDTSNQFFCGGSLVAPEFILTAAHCMTNTKWNLSKFLVGALCPFQSQDNNCGQYYDIKGIAKIYNHPQFNANTLVNDFSLVQLSTRSRIAPVTLDKSNTSLSYTSGKFFVIVD